MGACDDEGQCLLPTVTDSLVHCTGSFPAIRARTRLLPGSPHNTRLLAAISASPIWVSSRTCASPRNWRRHSLIAWACSALTHPATPGAIGEPVGRTKMKVSRNASSTGPWSPCRLCRPSCAAASPADHFAPFLTKCAFHALSDVGDGAVTACPSIVTVGLRVTSSGHPPGPMASVKAVTLLDCTVTAWSPVISASSRARSQCLPSASTVTHFIWLYASVQVVKRTLRGYASRPFATIASIIWLIVTFESG